jgi:hypothetical protein
LNERLINLLLPALDNFWLRSLINKVFPYV